MLLKFWNSLSLQGVLAQRRSNFRGAQFTLAKEAAKKAAVTPIRNRVLIRNRAASWNKPRYFCSTDVSASAINM